MGELQGQAGILFDEQDGHALFVEFFKRPEHVVHEQGGQPHGGFVKKQEVTARHESPAHGEHLLLAAAQGFAALFLALHQPGEEVVDPLVVCLDGIGILAGIGGQFQIFLDGEVAEDVTTFGSQGCLVFLHDGMGVDPQKALSLVQDFACCNLGALGRGNAGDGVQGGGLARTVGADEGHGLSLVNGQGNAVQGFDIAVTYVKVLYFEKHQIVSSPR